MTDKHVDSECVVLYIHTVWGQVSNSRMAIIGSDGVNSKLFLFICIVLLITSKINTIVSLQLLQCSVTLSKL